MLSRRERRIAAVVDYALGKPVRNICFDWDISHVTLIKWVRRSDFKLRREPSMAKKSKPVAMPVAVYEPPPYRKTSSYAPAQSDRHARADYYDPEPFREAMCRPAKLAPASPKREVKNNSYDTNGRCRNY